MPPVCNPSPNGWPLVRSYVFADVVEPASRVSSFRRWEAVPLHDRWLCQRGLPIGPLDITESSWSHLRRGFDYGRWHAHLLSYRWPTLHCFWPPIGVARIAAAASGDQSHSAVIFHSKYARTDSSDDDGDAVAFNLAAVRLYHAPIIDHCRTRGLKSEPSRRRVLQ